MSGGLAGLGAIAGGLSRGLADGQHLQRERDDAAWQMEQRARQRSLQARDDALQADLESANGAMRDRLAGFQTDAMRTQGPGPRNDLTLGGTDSSMPDQSAVDTPSAAPAAFKPTHEQLLDAAQARTDKLFSLGRHDAAVKQWVQDEGLRAQLRKKAATDGMMAFKATGDIKPLLTGIYKNIDDGYDLSNVEPVNNPDPKAPRTWAVERTNQTTGEKKVDNVSADQIDGLVQFAMDPVQAARYSLMEKLANARGDQQRQTNRERGDQTLDQIDRRNEGNVGVAEVRGQTARDVAETRADGTITAAQIRAAAARAGGKGGSTGGNIAKTEHLSDGRMLLIMRDGSQRIATDDNGKPLTSLEYEKLVGSTAGQVGKSLDGLTATPEANRDRARKLLPAPPPPGPKRLVYDPASGSFK